MTTDERKRVGRKLKALRIERGLNQVDVAKEMARDPKLKVSVGTLQAIEGNWYDARDTNIERYARYFGLTIKKLLQADEPRPVAPTDPQWKDLHEEHLEIARSYMKARKRVRTCVEILLAHHPAEDVLTTLFAKIAELPTERLLQLDAQLRADPDGTLEHLVDRLRTRLLVDPEFASLTRENLDLFDARVTPSKTAVKKPPAAPKRQA